MRPTHRVTAGGGGDGLERGAGAKDVVTAGRREESWELLREHIGKSSIRADLLCGKWRNCSDSLFSCAVFLMWSQSIVLAKTAKTHIYILSFSPTLSLFSSFFRFFFWCGLESFVETFLKEVVLAQTLLFFFLFLVSSFAPLYRPLLLLNPTKLPHSSF